MMKVLLIFSETNFIEAPKIGEICKIYGPQKGTLQYTVVCYRLKYSNKAYSTTLATS